MYGHSNSSYMNLPTFISMHLFWLWIRGCLQVLRLSISDWGYMTPVKIHSHKMYIEVFILKALHKYYPVFWKQHSPCFPLPPNYFYVTFIYVISTGIYSNLLYYCIFFMSSLAFYTSILLQFSIYQYDL